RDTSGAHRSLDASRTSRLEPARTAAGIRVRRGILPPRRRARRPRRSRLVDAAHRLARPCAAWRLARHPRHRGLLALSPRPRDRPLPRRQCRGVRDDSAASHRHTNGLASANSARQIVEQTMHPFADGTDRRLLWIGFLTVATLLMTGV